ncbi:MAG TPA: prohibitin family protein [Methylomirabilota bacterium]|jgi:regulator of protease activity HflC (stomatin/prohibitin superfamily)|nr:prohibitin family protein [Methylomirabilota bacterium]
MGKLIFAAVVFVLGYLMYLGLNRQRQALPGAIGVILPRVVLFLSIAIPAVILFFSVFRIIPAGQVGVKVLFGEVEPVPLREGLNVLWNPLYDVVIMDVRVQKHTARYDAASKDLQAVHVEMVLNYRVVPERAPEVYRSLGLGYSNIIIDPGAQEVLKANTALHNAAEILLRRPVIKNDVQQTLSTYLAKYGIDLREAALANIRFDANYEKAIEAKQIEEQKAEQKRYELIQAQRQAEIAAATAKGKGDAAREEARGVAEALRLKGEAEAAYNAKVSASLTPVLIQQQYLARWDGRLPQYTLGGNAVPFVQLPQPEGRR